MGRRVALVAAVVIVIAAGVWIALPGGREVTPGPGTPEATSPRAKAPAPPLAATGSAGKRAIPAGESATEAAVSKNPETSSAKEPWKGTLVLDGRIVDAAGKPVAGAKVRLLNTRPRPGEPKMPAVETGADGKFAFSDLASGPFQLWVDTGAGEELRGAPWPPGQGPIDVPPPVGPTRPPPPKDPALAVRVVGPDGKPIPRADLILRVGGRFVGFGDLKDGEFFRMPAEKDTTYQVVGARDEAWNPVAAGPAVWKPGDENVLTLPPGRTIEGTVVDADGKGVLGADVDATPKTADQIPERHGRATTDAAGHFRLVNLGEGPYRLGVTAPPPYLSPDVVDATVGSADTKIHLVRGLEADVTVLDPDGKPVLGARVDANAPMQMGRGYSRLPGTSEQITDVAGKAHLSQVDPQRTNGLSASPPRSRSDLGPWTSSDWDRKDATVRLPRAWTLFGTVHRADGSAGMSFVHRRVADGAWRIVTTTNKDGAFHAKFSDPGPWLLAASATGNGARGAEMTVTDASVPVTLEAPAAASPTPAPTPTK